MRSAVRPERTVVISASTDSLLGPVLMASTYPLEVVEAERWVRDPVPASSDRTQEIVDN
jgi:hypothetical protein